MRVNLKRFNRCTSAEAALSLSALTSHTSVMFDSLLHTCIFSLTNKRLTEQKRKNRADLFLKFAVGILISWRGCRLKRT